MKTYNRILRAFYSQPWAILEAKLHEIAAFLELKAAGGAVSDEELGRMRASFEAAASRSTAQGNGTVAVLPVMGTISHRTNMLSDFSGGCSVEKFTGMFRQALNDPNVKAIVLDIDSPGGSVAGVQELADEIFKARGQKPITAVANVMVASAAYWIASQADEIVATPSALVGSIGVYYAHEDDSAMQEKMGIKTTVVSAGKYKAELEGPLTDEARAYLQSLADDNYDMFVKAVARGRGVKASEVRNGFGQGRVLMAANAKEAGMVDRIATFDQVLQKYGVSRAMGQPLRAEEVPLDVQAAVNEAEADMSATSEPDAISRDIEMRRRMLQLTGA